MCICRKTILLVRPCASSNGLLAGPTVPDTDGPPLHFSLEIQDHHILWTPSRTNTTPLQTTTENTTVFKLHTSPRTWKGPYLATERAGVFGVLGDFNFLHHLPQRRAITRAIFTNDPHLLGALGLRTNGTRNELVQLVFKWHDSIEPPIFDNSAAERVFSQ